MIRARLNGFRQLFLDFWSKPIDPINFALFRIIFSLIYFVFVLSKTNELILFYSERGFLPAGYASVHKYLSLQKSIFFIYNADWILYAGHGIALVALICLALGYRTRTAAIVSYVMHLMFVNRNPAIQYGADFVSAFSLLYLSLSNCGARLSLDALQGRSRMDGELRIFLNTIAYRLLQLQLCIIYTYSGLAKIRGTRWWNGSAIWDVFTMEGLVRWDLSFIAYVPDLLVLLCYATLAWEIYFCVLIWLDPFRRPLIVFGVLMHLAFGVFIKIPFFSAVMASLYLLFLTPNEAHALANWLRSKCNGFANRTKLAN